MAIKIELGETIAAPPEQVYAALTDLDHAGQWMQGLVRIDKLTEGPFGQGTRWRERRKFFAHEATEVFEVVAAEPPRRLEIFCDGREGTSKSGRYRFTFLLSPQDQASRLTLQGEISGLSWLGELMGRLFSGAYRSMVAKDLKGLKRYLEAKSD